MLCFSRQKYSDFTFWLGLSFLIHLLALTICPVFSKPAIHFQVGRAVPLDIVLEDLFSKREAVEEHSFSQEPIKKEATISFQKPREVKRKKVQQKRREKKREHKLKKKNKEKSKEAVYSTKARNSSLAIKSGKQGRTAPKVLTAPKPPYPYRAIRDGFEGVVLLKIWINSKGDVEKAVVLKSSGRKDCDSSALETVLKKWKFVPAYAFGVPVPYEQNVAIVFKLEESGL
ncbi:MAG: energy transducer TonB [Candidatus Dadabacteria bacterium]|nr:MAG: energy transducer TonB [Candidatus Dadabacteria bacterium]